MILGRHPVLVKFVGELLRRQCQINRGKALLSRSNRRRGEMEKTERTRPRHVLVRFADRETDISREMYASGIERRF